jgi:predicted ATPase
MALLAEAYGQEGQVAAGLTVLTEAMALVDKTSERWWEAEMYRLKGELLLRSGVRELEMRMPHAEAAAACFRQAIDIARHQQAKSLELRAAMSLAHLWQRQGKRTAGRELLAEVYGWFTEGFDTADLKAARARLEECTSV